MNVTILRIPLLAPTGILLNPRWVTQELGHHICGKYLVNTSGKIGNKVFVRTRPPIKATCYSSSLQAPSQPEPSARLANLLHTSGIATNSTPNQAKREV